MKRMNFRRSIRVDGRRFYHVNLQGVTIQQENELKVTMKAEAGEVETHTFSSRYLRDSCHCEVCYNPDTFQRRVDSKTIPKGLKLRKVVHVNDTHTILEDDERHPLTIPNDFLWNHFKSAETQRLAQNKSMNKTTWTGNQFKNQPKGIEPQYDLPSVSFKDLYSDEGIPLSKDVVVQPDVYRTLLSHIATYGFALVHDTPADDDAPTRQVIETVSSIRNSLFGDFWEFEAKVQLDKMDTAYTSEAIESHTDNTYFQEPSRMLVLHCVHYDAVGGQTTLVDGFHVLQQLSAKSLDFFASTPLQFHYTQTKLNPHNMRHSQRVLQFHDTYTGADQRTSGNYFQQGNPLKIDQVRQFAYNNLDRDALVRLTPAQRDAFYEAYDELSGLISQSTQPVYLELRPGTVLFCDNWRLMHGRTSFTGDRRMIGAYLHSDDFESKVGQLTEEKPTITVANSL